MPYLVGTEFEPIMLPRECRLVRWIESGTEGRLALVSLVPPLPERFANKRQAPLLGSILGVVLLTSLLFNVVLYRQGQGYYLQLNETRRGRLGSRIVIQERTAHRRQERDLGGARGTRLVGGQGRRLWVS
jgi:hypothetical protein